MTMTERAGCVMSADPDRVFTLNELRLAVGIALRSQYRLAQQLADEPWVECLGGNRFRWRYGSDYDE